MKLINFIAVVFSTFFFGMIYGNTNNISEWFTPSGSMFLIIMFMLFIINFGIITNYLVKDDTIKEEQNDKNI
jgi:hypothetical protein